MPLTNSYAGGNLDDMARAKGYADFADMQTQNPYSASLLQHDADNGMGPVDPNRMLGRSPAPIPWNEIIKDFAIAGGGYLASSLMPAVGAAEAAPSIADGVSTLNLADLPGAASLALPPAAEAGAAATSGALVDAAATAPEDFSSVAAPEIGDSVTGLPGGNIAAAGGTAVGASVGSSLLDKIGKGLDVVGPALGAAANSAANNTSTANNDAIRAVEAAIQEQNAQTSAYGANTAGQSALQNELINRATLEDTQRATDLRNLFKDSTAQNPSRGPFDMQGPPKLSETYKAALQNLARQGGDELSKAPTFQSSNLTAMPKPTYTPLTSTPVTIPTPQVPNGPLTQVGNWVSPILTGVGAYLKKQQVPPVLQTQV